MAATESTMLALSTPAPAFALYDTEGNLVSRGDFADKPLLVMFICNHCPFVKHIAEELARLGRDYSSRGAGIVAISANDVANYPDDSPARMKAERAANGWTFPYLYDETQEVAKAYTAACTPDFFLFDAAHKLYYRGQLDDSRPGNGIPVTGADLRAALDGVLEGKPAPGRQKPSIGCNIKWIQGNEPDYFRR